MQRSRMIFLDRLLVWTLRICRAVLFCLLLALFNVLAEPCTDGEAENTQIYIKNSLAALYHLVAQQQRAPVFQLPAGWISDRYEVAGTPVEKYVRAGKTSSRVAIQFHGGAYVFALDYGYRYFALTEAEALGADTVYVFDYALAPEHIYPQALNEALRVYLDVLKEGIAAEQLIFVGDSSGANLALALAVLCRDQRLPLPRALVLLSPWGTLDDVPSHRDHAALDLVQGEQGNQLFFSEIRQPSFARGYDLKDPRISPAYADLTGLPALLIQAGGYETLLSDSEILRQRALSCGVPVQFTIYRGMPHDFQILLPQLPQSAEAFAEMRVFADRIFGY